MDTKKRAYAIVIIIFLMAAFGIVYIFSELSTEDELADALVTDAKIFKEEYENENNKELEDGTKLLSLNIEEENPIIYKEAKDIVEMINNKESFYVFFSYSTCSWCRNILPSLLESAKENEVDKIYYVDIANIRDTYELDEAHKPIRKSEGSEAYYKLLEMLDYILDDYTPLTYTTSKGKTKKVKVDEKRIYAPTLIGIKDGEAKLKTSGVLAEQTDPNIKQTQEQLVLSKYEFKCVFDSTKETSTDTCVCVDKKC